MKNPLRSSSFVARLVALAALVAPAALLGGCFGYNNVEPIEGSVAFENPNSPPVPQAMATALQWAALRYPPHVDRLDVGKGEQPLIAVNFPVGVRRDVAEYVCRNTGPWAMPLTTENDALPVYHIGRVWTRGLYATVDVFRPASQLGPAPEGTTLWQCITVQLRSGIGSYSVFSHKAWPVGAFDVPALHYLAPGHEGRTQPSSAEQPGRLSPLPGEKRTPATGAAHVQPLPPEPKSEADEMVPESGTPAHPEDVPGGG